MTLKNYNVFSQLWLSCMANQLLLCLRHQHQEEYRLAKTVDYFQQLMEFHSAEEG